MKFFEFIRKALSEDNGNPSSMRLNSFLVVFQFSVVMSFGFVWVIIYHPDLVLAYAGLLLSAVLGVLGIKTWQKGKENPEPASPEEKPGGTQ